ncbi:MAG: type II secretion system F family protein [Magnetococcales bacterium]|nr:type II secretion system F family protein [Magnetococcales bacterium]
MAMNFQWEAIAKSGEKRQGEMEAENSGVAMAILRKQGYRNITLKSKPKGKTPKARSITDKEVVIFTRQLATMVSAGLPLVTCFDLVARGSENPAIRDATLRVKEAIEAGTSLTEAMSKETKMFDDLFVNLVAAGEQSGILDTVLDRLAIYKEKSSALKAKIKSAMTYPIAVVVIALVISGVLMIFVVPAFKELFSSFGAQLPLPTRIAISMSEWTQKYWWLVLASLGGGVFAFKTSYKNNAKFHYQVDKFALRAPVFGTLVRKSAVARFARTFSTMVAAGTPILECLDNVAKTSGNKVVEEAIRNARSSIAEGRTLTEPLAASGIFPYMVTQMINIGESTGNLETMLSKIADFYEEEVDRAVDSLTALMEPFILVFLGGLIGGLVVAMYMPIFQMGQAVG